MIVKNNSDFIRDQTAYLTDLIEFKDYPDNLKHRDIIGWSDWEYGQLAVVTRKDALFVLNKVSSEELTIKDYYDWANSLIGRDTIGYETGYKKLIDDIISVVIPDYEAGAFATHSGIEYAKELIQKIQDAKFDAHEDDD